MTIDELLERLEDAKAELGGETEIKVAIQESWPLRCNITAVTVGDEEADGGDAEFLWIGVSQVGSSESDPYAPRWAWDGRVY